MPSLTVLPPDRCGLHHHPSKGITMTLPHPDPNAATPEGYDQPEAAPYKSGDYPTGSQPEQPYASPQQGYSAGPQQPYQQPQYQGHPPAPQQPQYQSDQQAPLQPQYQQQPYTGPQQGHPAGPQQPYQQPQSQGYGAGPQQPHYQSYPPAPLQPQYQQQPPMPNPAYGYPQPKSKLIAGLLGLFLGGLGIHRFYLGFTKVAVIQLVLTLVVSIFTLGFGLFLVGLWGFIEGIMILAGSAHFQRDAHGIPLRDWLERGNTLTQVIHDRPDQLDQINAGLLQGEIVYAVYDCIGVGTGFVGITNMRVIIQDKSFVGNKLAIVSVPYKNIRSVAMYSNKSMMGRFASTSTIGIDTGSTVKEADFRGDDKARHAHDLILWNVLNTK
jgi:TM2 domain-containing membrane protein YozV